MFLFYFELFYFIFVTQFKFSILSLFYLLLLIYYELKVAKIPKMAFSQYNQAPLHLYRGAFHPVKTSTTLTICQDGELEHPDH